MDIPGGGITGLGRIEGPFDDGFGFLKPLVLREFHSLTGQRALGPTPFGEEGQHDNEGQDGGNPAAHGHSF